MGRSFIVGEEEGRGTLQKVRGEGKGKKGGTKGKNPG